TGGPIIWGNSAGAILNINKSNYTDPWNTAKFTFTVTEELQNGMIAFLCQRTTYFDNITIIDITDTINTDEPNFDFNNGGEVLFIETSDRTTVTTEQDDEKGAVAKIAFNAGTSTQDGEISLPFALGEGKSYVVKITYKSNAWVACDWADKPIRGDSGLDPTTKWVTETRYISGTNGDLLNFYSNPGTEIYIAKIEITEADEAGGLNGDGVIDTTDYTLMRNRFFAAKRDDSTMFEKYADQNGDGTVDILDMVRLSLKSANNYQ
ncbi:MAG: hypothetical protein II334_03430, partial [Clostridia bacterium]|nr:hypothetical protein [Clostridia bacterium]